jgi:hypothetical protein
MTAKERPPGGDSGGPRRDSDQTANPSRPTIPDPHDRLTRPTLGAIRRGSSAPDRIPDWVVTGDDPPVEPAEMWPDDILTEEEWERGWFDRQVLAGRLQPWERAIVSRWLGGDMDDPPEGGES